MSNKINDPSFECQDRNFLEKAKGAFIADRFNHELFMVIEEKGRLIIVSSCSHNGIINILNTVKKSYPGQSISHIIGGFHFAKIGLRKKLDQLNCPEEQVLEVAQILKDSGAKILTGHCTGKKAYGLMKEELGDELTYFSTGQKITID